MQRYAQAQALFERAKAHVRQYGGSQHIHMQEIETMLQEMQQLKNQPTR
ncbi:hypothetical protein HC761_00465 [bacterium]|nr:hypothetical protein [bacterium]